MKEAKQQAKDDFQKEHLQLHKEWTAAVGQPTYDKQIFRDKEKQLNEKYFNQSNPTT